MAAQRGNAFVSRTSRDLDLIFSLQFERVINRDNTVSFQNLNLQIEPVRFRATLAGCNAMVHYGQSDCHLRTNRSLVRFCSHGG